jgi:hypothetical protein
MVVSCLRSGTRAGVCSSRRKRQARSLCAAVAPSHGVAKRPPLNNEPPALANRERAPSAGCFVPGCARMAATSDCGSAAAAAASTRTCHATRVGVRALERARTHSEETHKR